MDDKGWLPISQAQRKIEQFPTHPLILPRNSGSFELDQTVVEVLASQGAKLVNAFRYAQSLNGETAKLIIERSDQQQCSYFVKVVVGDTGGKRCEAEYESLRAIYNVSPNFVPAPIAWGRYGDQSRESFFLLEDFREIGSMPAHPSKLVRELANLHTHSKSPTGKFGFHIETWHGGIAQNVMQWDDSWAALFGRHLGHILDIATGITNIPEFSILCHLTVTKVVSRLLLPLQDNGRVLKPCLLHGDCWDGNTALDANTGEAFVFDACSFYGHNEYDIGNWRAPRHRLSDEAYVQEYKNIIAVSEPVEDWAARNLLYSLCFNAGNMINIPHSKEAEIVYDDMRTLCRMFCPSDLEQAMTISEKTCSQGDQ